MRSASPTSAQPVPGSTEAKTRPDPFARARQIARRIIFAVSALIVVAFSIVTVTVNCAAPPMPDPLPSHVRDPYRSARAALREGDRISAGVMLQMVRETDDDYPRAMRLLSGLLRSSGNERQAVPYANEAVLVDPLNGDSWVGLAKTYVRTFGKVVRGD